jgi:Ca2+-binding RTX toxin-like protein
MYPNLMKAILAMDSYNRGYDEGILFSEGGNVINTQLGSATIVQQSDFQANTDGVNAGFYALAYTYNGETVISYRGTDTPPDVDAAIANWDITELFTPDVWNGWFIGGLGNEQAEQARLAFQFYQEVVGGTENIYDEGVSLTGHSLGGGLAGLVGGAYGHNAVMFDQMPFEKALLDTYAYSYDPQSPDYNAQLRQNVYGAEDVESPDYYQSQLSFSLEGEALSEIRNNFGFGTIVTSTIPENTFDLGTNVDLVTGDDDVALHSMSTLVIRLFFSSEDPLFDVPAWNPAAQYFWATMYDETFAGQIGMATSSNVNGTLQAEGKYSDILRQIIAYSAIDEGGTVVDGENAARPFGDVAIRALYNDANELGAVLADEDSSQVVVAYATNISKSFVQFAGQMALEKVLQSENPETLAGVLSVSGDALTISFNDDLWKTGGTEVPPMIARAALVGDFWTDTGGETLIRSTLLSHWGDDTTNVIERVVLTAKDTGGTYDVTDAPSSSEQGNMVIGSIGVDIVTGSSGKDLLFGADGDDELNGGAGDDILFGGGDDDELNGGAGNDILFGGTGENVIDGGDDVDTVDYSTSAVGVTVNLNIESQLNGDTISNVENIIGSGFDDSFMDQQEVANFYNGSGGQDTLDYTGWVDGLIFDMRVNAQAYQAEYKTGTITTTIEYDLSDIWQSLLDANVEYTLSDNENTFQSIENVIGGSGNDWFIDDGAASNFYDGGSGFNVLDLYYNWTGLYGGWIDLSVGMNFAGEAHEDSFTNIHGYVHTWGTSFTINNKLVGSEDLDFSFWVEGGVSEYQGDPEWKDGVYISPTQHEIVYFNDADNRYEFLTNMYTALVWNNNEESGVYDEPMAILSVVDMDGNLVDQRVIEGGVSTSDFTFWGIGTDSADTITGDRAGTQAQDDVMNGYGGNDILNAGDGNDVLSGGAGNDIENGGAGDDDYKFQRGDGNNEINEDGGFDEIVITDNSISANDITLTRIGDDLDITIASGYLIKGFYSGDADKVVEQIRFYDNSVMDLTYLLNVNVAPVITSNGGGSTASLNFYESVSAVTTVTASDSNPNTTLIYSISGGVDSGKFTINSATGVLSFLSMPRFDVPSDSGANGIYDVQVQVSDGSLSDTQDLAITVFAPAGSTVGTSSADTITGTSSADTIFGLGGNDNINGGSGNDVIRGGAGNDTINGGADIDTVSYETAPSSVTVHLGNSYASGGDGDDTLSNLENIIGSGYNDTLYGNSSANVISGGAGIDNIYGYGGNDTLNGGDGVDILVGGLGDDYMDGGNGTDRVNYGTATAGVVVSLILGTASGADGNDTFINIESIDGSAYDDTLIGNSGNNVILGNAGNDIIIGEAGDDILYGHQGTDLVSYENAVAAVTVSLLANTASGGDGNDTLSTFENVKGSAYNDTLSGDNFANTIYGGAGNDSINGNSGNDTLYGEAGNDSINGGTGSDTIYGGDGNDIFSGLDTGDVVDGGADTDLLDYSAAYAVTANLTTGSTTGNNGTHSHSNIENITGSIYADTLRGNSGANVLKGGNGNDTLYGEDGNDELEGGAGSDTLDGYSGDDTFIYTAGLDTAIDTGGADIIRMGAGIDINAISFTSVSTYNTKIVISSGTNELLVQDLRHSTTSYHIERIAFADGFETSLPDYASWVNGTGSADLIAYSSADDTILGKGGNDTITAGSGADDVHGGDGNDSISGEGGNDLLHGGAGDDTLYGGDGLDTLFGGAGDDTFVFENTSALNNVDVIKDFSTAQGDAIDISDVISLYDSLNDVITDWVEMATSGSDTILKVDQDGTGTTYGWTQIATITGVTGLTDEAALVTNGNLIVT